MALCLSIKVPKRICDLDDNSLVHIMQYLLFDDIIKSLSKVNKRMNELAANPNIIYSVESFLGRDKYMRKYCKYLMENKRENAFCYTNIQVLDLSIHQNDNIQLLLKHTGKLQTISVYGDGFDILQNLKIQKNVIHLILWSDNVDLGPWDNDNRPLLKLADSTYFGDYHYGKCKPQMSIYQFLSSKIDIHSLYRLKTLHVQQIKITIQILQILSKMINLESLKFGRLLYEPNDIINPLIISQTFKDWKLKTLSMYETDECFPCSSTFYDHPVNAVVLSNILSIKTLKSLTFAVPGRYMEDEHFDDERLDDEHFDDEQFDRIKKLIVSYFTNVRNLDDLQFILCVGVDMQLMLDVLTVINNASSSRKIRNITIDATSFAEYEIDELCGDEDENECEFANILNLCLRTVSQKLAIAVSVNYECLLEPVANIIDKYCDADVEGVRKIKIEELCISVHGDGMELITFFLNKGKMFKQSCHKISKLVKIEMDFNDKISNESWNTIKASFKQNGFGFSFKKTSSHHACIVSKDC